jgi:hypothetical protein
MRQIRNSKPNPGAKNGLAPAVLSAGLALVLSLTISAGDAQAAQSGSSSDSSSAAAANSTSSTQADAAPQDSLAAAARKAKEAKAQNKPAKVFTNDNLPTTGVISTVGVASSASSSSDASAAAPAAGAQGEKFWRDRFATLNAKLTSDQSELDVMQRELGQLNLQNYSDPVQAMQQGLSRGDIDKKTADIDAKQKQIDADKQAIEDAQDDLRKAGGDPGWAR